MNFLLRSLLFVSVLGIAGGSAPSAQELGEEIWLQPGPWAWGTSFYQGTLDFDDGTYAHRLMLSYPAVEEGIDVPAATTGRPFPVIFFEHAGGDAYDSYDYLFRHLSSHGMIVVSADHSDSMWEASTGGYWDRHRDLFLRSIELVRSWSEEDLSSPLYGAVDFKRLALGGHSHGAGAALLAMKMLRPIDPAGPEEVLSLGLIAPCPQGVVPMQDYPLEFAGLPPLQVIYGSKDRDVCVAHGRAIAIYEPLTRPRHYSYVVGASHHGFTDDGFMAEARISRVDHQRAAAAATLAWYALTLNGDTAALPYLRGEAALLDDTPEVRYQFHDSSGSVVDDFEEPAQDYGVAIAHVPGQVFVNGFLSDTFVDFEAGVSLVQEQIAALFPTTGSDPRSVLFYEDAVRGSSVYAEALAREAAGGRINTPVFVTNPAEFGTLLMAGQWDLVVSANQGGSGSTPHPFDAPLAAWVCDGRKTIISDFRIQSETAEDILECAQTRFDGLMNWSRMTTVNGSPREFDMTDPGWGIWTYGLETDAQVYATNDIILSEAEDPAENTINLPVNGEGLDTFLELFALDTPRTIYHPTDGLELAWSSPGARLSETVAPAWTPGYDASLWGAVSMRLLQLYGDPLNPDRESKDLHVKVVDRSGRSVGIALSETAQGPLRPSVEPSTQAEYKSVFETYQLPLAEFLRRDPALDLSALDTIELVFDLTPTGRIVVDDIQFVSRCDAAGSSPPSVGNLLLVGKSADAAVLDWSAYPWSGTAEQFRVHRSDSIGDLPGQQSFDTDSTQWTDTLAGDLVFYDVRAIKSCGAIELESLD